VLLQLNFPSLVDLDSVPCCATYFQVDRYPVPVAHVVFGNFIDVLEDGLRIDDVLARLQDLGQVVLEHPLISVILEYLQEVLDKMAVLERQTQKGEPLSGDVVVGPAVLPLDTINLRA